MKNFFISLVMVCLVFTVSAHGAQNLAPNAGFEEPMGIANDNPTDWWSWNPDYNGISIEKMRTGVQSVYLSCPPEPESHGGILYYYNAVKPGKTYTFSCYVINSDKDTITKGAYGQLSVEWKNGGQEIFRSWGPVFGAGLSASKWIFESITAEAPADSDGCNFVVQLFGKDGKGTFFVDDVTIEEK
jgi:hypothetical protein